MPRFSPDRASAVAVALIVAAGAGYALLAAHAGLPPATRFPGDDFLWFEGALRILHGQVPHTDFYSPLGALHFQVPAWIMAATGRSVAAFGTAMAIFGVVLAGLTWFACRDRMPVPFTAALTALALVFLLSLRGYGYEFHALGFAAWYNKAGSVLLIAALVAAFAPRRDADGTDAARVAVLALALALAFFLKVTVFALIAGIAVAGETMRCGRRPLGAVAIMAATFGLAAVLIAAYALTTGVPLGAYLADIGLAGTAKGGLLTGLPWLLYILWPPEFLLYLLVPVTVAALAVPASDGAALLRHGVLLAAGLAIAALLPVINSQGPEAFFPAALAVALAGTAWRRRADAAPERPGAAQRARCALLALFLAVGALAVVLPNLGGEIYGRVVPLPRLQGSDTILEVPVAGSAPWRFYPHRSQPQEGDYVRALARGAARLVAETGPETTVAALDFANPFPFLLGARPPAGGAAWWHVGINLNAEVAARLAPPTAGACLVMEPKGPYMRDTRDFLRDWARAALAEGYLLHHEDADWRIWRARAGCPPAPG